MAPRDELDYEAPSVEQREQIDAVLGVKKVSKGSARRVKGNGGKPGLRAVTKLQS